MSRGYPDFGVAEEFGSSLTPLDTGEIAARLGSIITFDRRGLVVDFDNFEAPVLKWAATALAPGDIYLDSSYAKSGVQCVVMKTPNIANTSVVITKAVSILLSQRLGFEFSFAFALSGMYLHLIVDQYDGTYKKTIQVRIYNDTGVCQYVDGDSVFQTIATIGEILRGTYPIHTFKVVADFENNLYVRFMLNNREYSIATGTMAVVADTTNPHISIAMYIYTDGAVSRTARIDDFVLTKDEP